MNFCTAVAVLHAVQYCSTIIVVGIPSAAQHVLKWCSEASDGSGNMMRTRRPLKTLRALGHCRSRAVPSASRLERGLASVEFPKPGKVGIVGVGQLGRAVSGNLIRDGLAPVLHDIQGSAVAQDLLERGASWAATPRELAERCDVVITGLPEPTHVMAAMGLEEDGSVNDVGILFFWPRGVCDNLKTVRRTLPLGQACGVARSGSSIRPRISGPRCGSARRSRSEARSSV